MIWQATDGAFFRDAIGGDLAPKIAGGQEKHGALPGYYLLTLPILFWPGTLILITGLANGMAQARQRRSKESGWASVSTVAVLDDSILDNPGIGSNQAT